MIEQSDLKKMNGMNNHLTPSQLAHHQLSDDFHQVKPVEGPAQLWLGAHEQLTREALRYLQEQFCTQNNCGICTSCTQILDKQHHAILWIEPEKQYTLDMLEPVRTTIAYALEQNTHFFFVLARAELLSVSCQNSLLKTIEEPPTGYHFIFLANNKDAILPTILSRCVIKQYAIGQAQSAHPLFTFFRTKNDRDPQQLLKLLEEHKLTEQETIALVNQLLAFWLGEYKRTLKAEATTHVQIRHIINILNQGLLNPPMPGGSGLFWKISIYNYNHYINFFYS